MSKHQKWQTLALIALNGASPGGWLLFTLLTRNHFGLEVFTPAMGILCLTLNLTAGLSGLLWKAGEKFWTWGRVIGWTLLALGAAGWIVTLTRWFGGWQMMLGDGRLTEPLHRWLRWCSWSGLASSLAGLLPGVFHLMKPGGEA